MRVAAVAAACLGLTAAPAAAAPARRVVNVVPGSTSSGCAGALAGPEVVYGPGSASAGRQRVTVLARRPGAAPRVLMDEVLPAGVRGDTIPNFGPCFSASSQRVGLILEKFKETGLDEPDFRGSELWSGPLSGRLTRIMRGSGGSGPRCRARPLSFAVAGNVLVDAQTSCATGAYRVVIRDFARGGAPETLRVAAQVGQVAAAGRFVAWLESPQKFTGSAPPWAIVVYDLGRKAEAYRVPAREAHRIDRLQIQADGTVLVDGLREPRPGQPSGSFLTRYALDGTSTEIPRDPDTLLWSGRNFGGDRILVGRFVRGPVPGAPAIGEALAISDLSGRLTPLAHGPGTFGVDTDFDGRSALYSQQACVGMTLYLQDVHTGAVAGPPDAACPVKLTGGVRRVRGGRAPLPVSCPRGCYGMVTLAANGRRIAPARRLSLAGGHGTLTFALDARTRRALASHPVSVTATARSGDLDRDARVTTTRLTLRWG